MTDGRRTALWAAEALLDLDEIWTYYMRVAGRNTAENTIRRIGEVVTTIEEHPFAGRTRDELRPGFRSLAATPHVVFYRIIDSTPQIIRVLDGRRDLEEIFSD